MSVLLMNIVMTIYIGTLMPMVSSKENKILLFNELMIQFISIQVLLFTDWVISEDDKFYYGWHLCFYISVMILFNMSFVVQYMCRVGYLVCIKYYNIVTHYFNMFDYLINPEVRPAQTELVPAP